MRTVLEVHAPAEFDQRADRIRRARKRQRRKSHDRQSLRLSVAVVWSAWGRRDEAEQPQEQQHGEVS